MNNFLIVLTIIISGIMNGQNKAASNNKIVIAHRGASGYLPEHTLESKAMAYAMKPDFIEQDLVLSKDNIPIVIHDIYLDDVTNVSETFPKRKRKDGRFYVIDFSFEELKVLAVRERFDPKTKKVIYKDRFPYGKSTFKLHSLQDEIELIQGLNKSTGNDIGIYPEIKDPKFHRENGKDISKIVLQILNDYGYQIKADNCVLQCFDPIELKRIRNELNSELFLTQLIEFSKDELNLKEYASYSDAIGPWIKQLIKGYDKNGNIVFSELVKNAHDLDLKVHAYTFRADQLENIPSFEKLLEIGFYGANIDGAFTDFPDLVVEFLTK